MRQINQPDCVLFHLYPSFLSPALLALPANYISSAKSFSLIGRYVAARLDVYGSPVTYLSLKFVPGIYQINTVRVGGQGVHDSPIDELRAAGFAGFYSELGALNPALN